MLKERKLIYIMVMGFLSISFMALLVSHTPYRTLRWSKTKKNVKFIFPWNHKRQPKYCNPIGVLRKNGFYTDRESISCKPVKASDAGCRLAEKLYSKRTLKTCGNASKIVNICIRNDAYTAGSFECDFGGCRRHKKSKVIIWRTDEKTQTV